MRIKFIVSLLPFMLLAFTKIRENNTNKKLINEGIIFLLPILGLLFDNKLIMMAFFIVCSVLAALYRIHIFKGEEKNKLNIILHSIYYLIPIIVFIILYKEPNMIYYYITLGLLIYIDNFFNILVKKIFNKGKSKKQNEKSVKKDKSNNTKKKIENKKGVKKTIKEKK